MMALACGVMEFPTPIPLAASDPDGDPLTAFITGLPTHGTLLQTADGVTAGPAITNVPDRIKMLTAAEVYDAAQAYLDTDRYVKVILMPQR